MPKNHKIESKVSEDVDKAFRRKAEEYGGITHFIEAIAKFDIIILDKNAGNAIRTLMEKKK